MEKELRKKWEQFVKSITNLEDQYSGKLSVIKVGDWWIGEFKTAMKEAEKLGYDKGFRDAQSK